MLIQCSKKMAAGLNLATGEAGSVDPFAIWQADLVTISRFQGLLLINSQTRFAVFRFAMLRPDWRHLNGRISQYIRESLLAEGFPEARVDRYLMQSGPLCLARADNRALAGQMAEYQQALQVLAGMQGLQVFDPAHIHQTNQWLNQITLLRGEYQNGLEGMQAGLSDQARFPSFRRSLVCLP